VALTPVKIARANSTMALTKIQCAATCMRRAQGRVRMTFDSLLDKP
jgi:hypothetical protein